MKIKFNLKLIPISLAAIITIGLIINIAIGNNNIQIVGNNINVKLAEGKQAAVLGAATELAQAQITPRVSCPDYIGSTCPAGQKLISVPGRNGCNLPKCVPDVCPTSGNFAVCPIPTQGYCRGQWIYPPNNYDTCGCS